MINIKSIILILTLVLISGCIVVKHNTVEDEVTMINLSPKPEIPMSDKLVRSKKGDIIAFLPQDWFFVNVEEKASADVFAVAVNPDYTLSAVFSAIRKNDITDSIVSKEGLLGLARTSLSYHENKTAGAVKQVGKYSLMQLGTMSFAKYNYSNSSGALVSQTAVFKSSINQYYEFALIPMNITGKSLPSQIEIDKIFNSIVATIQY
ncbi:MAG: hypothetical protein A2X61_03200 [Ignavibacteria bacterium GWB2_35_12]|nr:MAG: hypothetical protein A2X61_03200 [Ignavibacteria bacterium GWB2_35_12]OGU95247.1 MAG: hypothetical protein A2220_02135 [Ignavibacteria bacterium RIFOXYA2_FULL_35_10]OGV20771.1 MAG: hypothetical protein A2475_11345 [Ignavibacteria bacterium RIFOXYC2_FULL_35_21]